jgi:hypothetical protein
VPVLQKSHATWTAQSVPILSSRVLRYVLGRFPWSRLVASFDERDFLFIRPRLTQKAVWLLIQIKGRKHLDTLYETTHRGPRYGGATLALAANFLQPTTDSLVLYPFGFRDPVSAKWVRARYVAEREVIASRYREWEITGTPELRRPACAAVSWARVRRSSAGAKDSFRQIDSQLSGASTGRSGS